MTNIAAERALRCIAVGRNNWTFAGSDGVAMNVNYENPAIQLDKQQAIDIGADFIAPSVTFGVSGSAGYLLRD